MRTLALLAIVILIAACGEGDLTPSTVENFEIGLVLRTPEERFAGLDDYPFASHYVQAGRVRIHYLDEGPRNAPVVMLLHGEPSWSYLYRKMIPILVAAGYRVVVPDLVGFGKSDKPADQVDYSYERHTAWMRFVLEDQLDLREVTMFLQDWGGLIGLRLAAESPQRYSRIVVANTGLPEGEGDAPPVFAAFRRFVETIPTLPIGALVDTASARPLTPAEIAAYDAPFPDESYKAGARVFPALVPFEPDNPGVAASRATWQILERWENPLLTAFSDGDPITRGGDVEFQTRIPGARGQAHTTIRGAGHFLQEDAPQQLGEIILDFIQSHP